jgi:hypothetical protein
VEVVDEGAATEVEGVHAGAAIACATPLPAADLSEVVLDGDALAQFGAAVWGRRALAQFGEQALVGVDGDAAAVGAGGAAVAERAGDAGLLREADGAARRERQYGAVGAADRESLPGQRTGGLGEAVAVADRPGPAEQGEVGRSLVDEGAAEVVAVDVQFVEPGGLVGEVGDDRLSDRGFWVVGRRDADRAEQA